MLFVLFCGDDVFLMCVVKKKMHVNVLNLNYNLAFETGLEYFHFICYIIQGCLK